MPRRSGFTLLELTLVLVLIVILAAMAYPSMEAMYVDAKLRAGADHLRARFAEARARAIDEGRAYRFAVKPNTSDYRLAPDSPEFWGEGQGLQEEASVQPLEIEDKVTGDILFQFGDNAALYESPNGWTTLVTFNPDGSCNEDRIIRLEYEDARPVELEIRALTGSVSARNAVVEAQP